MAKMAHRAAIALAIVCCAAIVTAQGMGGMGEGTTVNYTAPGLKAAPRRGTAGIANDGNLIYGPLEAGFTAAQIANVFSRAGTCANTTYEAPGGLDTELAEEAIEFACGFNVSILNACGGHANPFHYHERMTCLWNGSDTTGHSSKAGDMLDGHGLYGYYETNGTWPVLDACGGHFGFTPDSPNQRVYHYHITLTPPFTVGCFGPKIDNGTEALVTLADCRAAVPECDGLNLIAVETAHGAVLYDPDCPCYDGNGSSVANASLPFESAPSLPTAPPPPTATPTAVTTAAPAAPPPPPPPPPPASRRSVLLFMPDDMPFLWPEQPADPATGSTTAYNTQLVPNMNRVRTEGVIFTNAYAVSPKCAPARFNTLTGRYCSRGVYARDATRTGTRVNVEVPTCKIDGTDTTSTVQHALSAAGYRTVFSGKYHLLPERTDGTDWWSDYPAVATAVNATGFSADGGTYQSNMGGDTLNFTHNLEWTTSLTRAAIGDAVAAGAPFFVAFWPTMPHGPSPLGALRRGDPLATPNGTLANAPADAGMPTRQSVIAAAPTGNDSSTWAGTIATDAALGALMGKLEDLNALDSTVVLVLMDHGMISKDSLYEGGSRIAMMAQLPGVFPAGSVVSRVVTNLDVAPTLLEIASVAPPFQLDGASFLADASGQPSAVHRNYVYGEMDTDRSVTHVPSRFKLVSRSGATPAAISNYPASTDVVQLYDLAVDPTEQTNLAANSSHAAKLADLQSVLACYEAMTRLQNPVPTLLCDTPAPTVATTAAPVTSAPTVSTSLPPVRTTTASPVTTTASFVAGSTTATTVATGDSGGVVNAASEADNGGVSTAELAIVLAVVGVALVAAVVAVVVARARRHPRGQPAVVAMNGTSPFTQQHRESPSTFPNPVYTGPHEACDA